MISPYNNKSIKRASTPTAGSRPSNRQRPSNGPATPEPARATTAKSAPLNNNNNESNNEETCANDTTDTKKHLTPLPTSSPYARMGLPRPRRAVSPNNNNNNTTGTNFRHVFTRSQSSRSQTRSTGVSPLGRLVRCPPPTSFAASRSNDINRKALCNLVTTYETPSERTLLSVLQVEQRGHNERLVNSLRRFKRAAQHHADVLDASHCNLNEQDYIILKSVVSTHPTLREVVLDGNHVDAFAAALLLQIAQENENIHVIVLSNTDIPASWLSRIDAQLALNVRNTELKRIVEEQALIKAQRKQNAKEFREIVIEFLVHEQIMRHNIGTDEEAERAVLRKLKKEDHKVVTLELRRQRREQQHRQRMMQCQEDEVIARSLVWGHEDRELLAVFVTHADGVMAVIDVEQDTIRKKMRLDERDRWIEARRVVRARLEREHRARVVLGEAETRGRTALERSEVSARDRVEYLCEEHFNDAKEREAIRVEREKQLELQRIRAEEAARDKKEREEAHMQRLIQQRAQEQFRQRDRVMLEFVSLRKQRLIEEEALFRLALGANKIAMDYLKVRDRIFIRQRARAKDMVLKPNVKIEPVLEPPRFFHSSVAATHILDRVFVSCCMPKEWCDRLNDNEKQIQKDYRDTCAEQKKARDLFNKYRSDKSTEKLDPNGDHYKTKVALRRGMMDPAEGAIENPVVLNNPPVSKIVAEKEIIWGGTIRVQMLKSPEELDVNAHKDTKEYQEKLGEHDHLFVGPLGDGWSAVPNSVPVPPTYDPVGPTPSSSATTSRRPSEMLLSKSGTEIVKEEAVAEEGADADAADEMDVMSSNTIGDFDELEFSVDEIVPVYTRATDFTLSIPTNGTVTAAVLCDVLQTIGYRNQVTTLDKGPVVRYVSVDIVLEVATQEQSTTDPVSGVVTRPTGLSEISVQLRVPVVVCHLYVWIPLAMRELVYEEGDNVENCAVCSRVVSHNPPVFLHRGGGGHDVVVVGGSSAGSLGSRAHTSHFGGGRIILKFERGYTVDDQLCFHNSPQTMWIMDSLIYMKGETEDVQVGRVMQGALPRSSALPRTGQHAPETIIDLIPSPVCSSAVMRQLLVRIRYGNLSRDPIEGQRILAISIEDAEGVRCTAHVYIDVVAHDDPAELIIKNKKVCHRQSVISAALRKDADTGLMFTKIAVRGQVVDEDTDRFLGGWMQFNIDSGAQKGDMLGIVCAKYQPTPVGMDRKTSTILDCGDDITLPLPSFFTPSPVATEPTQSVFSEETIEVISPSKPPEIDAPHEESQRTENPSEKDDDDDDDDENALFSNKPTLYITEDKWIVFEDRRVAKLNLGKCVDVTMLPEAQAEDAGTVVEIEFDTTGAASVSAAQEILQSIVFFSTLARPADGDRKVSVSVQLGNTVPKPDVTGKVKAHSLKPDDWDPPMLDEIVVKVTPEVFAVPPVYGTLEYREGAGPVRLAPFDTQPETIACYDAFAGAYIRIEIVDGFQPDDDLLGIKSSADCNIKSRRVDSTSGGLTPSSKRGSSGSLEESILSGRKPSIMTPPATSIKSGRKSTLAEPTPRVSKSGSINLSDSTALSATLPPSSSRRVSQLNPTSLKERLRTKIQQQARKNIAKRNYNVTEAVRQLQKYITAPDLAARIDGQAKVKEIFFSPGDRDGVVFHSKNQIIIQFVSPLKKKELTSVLRNLTYTNVSNDPQVTEKVVRVVFFDGQQSGTQALIPLQVTNINDVTSIIVRNERSVYSECSASVIDAGAFQLCGLGDLKLEDPDTRHLDGGTVHCQITSGHTNVDCLGLLTPEQQQHAWPIARKQRATNEKLAADYPLPREQYIVSMDDQQQLRLQDGTILGTVSFPPVENWPGSNDFTLTLSSYQPPLINLPMLSYVMSCITYRQTGPKFVPGIRLYTYKVIDKANPTPGKLRQAVDCRAGVFTLPEKSANGLYFTDTPKKYSSGSQPVVLVPRPINTYLEKEKTLTSGFVKFTVLGATPKDSLVLVGREFTTMKEGKELSLYHGKDTYMGKFKCIGAHLQLDFSWASKARSKNVIDLLKCVGFKSSDIAENRTVQVEVSDPSSGEVTVARIIVEKVK